MSLGYGVVSDCYNCQSQIECKSTPPIFQLSTRILPAKLSYLVDFVITDLDIWKVLNVDFPNSLANFACLLTTSNALPNKSTPYNTSADKVVVDIWKILGANLHLCMLYVSIMYA